MVNEGEQKKLQPPEFGLVGDSDRMADTSLIGSQCSRADDLPCFPHTNQACCIQLAAKATEGIR